VIVTNFLGTYSFYGDLLTDRTERFEDMDVWQGVTMDSLKYHPARHAMPTCHTTQPAMPDTSKPCEQVTPEKTFQGWPAHRVGSLQLSSIPLDTPRRTPMFEGRVKP
jgi:hypothetical protein